MYIQHYTFNILKYLDFKTSQYVDILMMNIVQGILESVSCLQYTTFSILNTISSVFISLMASLSLFLILIRQCHKTFLKIKCCPSQEHYVASVLQHNSSTLTPITLPLCITVEELVAGKCRWSWYQHEWYGTRAHCLASDIALLHWEVLSPACPGSLLKRCGWDITIYIIHLSLLKNCSCHCPSPKDTRPAKLCATNLWEAGNSSLVKILMII